jgi:hypothetical protein
MCNFSVSFVSLLPLRSKSFPRHLSIRLYLVATLLQPRKVPLITESERAPRDSGVMFIINPTNTSKLICIVSICEDLGSFLGVQRPGSEVNHTPSSHAEIKNEWSRNFTHPICLHSANRENLHLITIRKL